ncbi:S8 family serine peptidase [Membranihabitans marinus]|uniref:S8 family serine peptidase n=1 Tax=Membranihabitans marinus TaxID=1227546 RepID=UPI001F0166B1|nr:S8 family serine peptidase [Membranihabitans marinus]
MNSHLSAEAFQPNYVDGELLIQTDGTPLSTILASSINNRNLSKAQQYKSLGSDLNIYLYSFSTDVESTEEVYQRISQHPNIRNIQYNHYLSPRRQPNDENYIKQWALMNTDNNLGIGMESAWDITTGGQLANKYDIIIAVIDDGFNIEHPDLHDNMFKNVREIPNNNIDDDGNGFVDDYRGWNPDTESDSIYSGNHGNLVAGVLGAVGNNNIGISGINWSVKILPLLLNKKFTEDGLISSYLYAYEMRKAFNESNGEKGGLVVATNSSWGISGYFPNEFPIWCGVYETLYNEGILNCVATGNRVENVDQLGDLPSLCSSESLIVVTSTDENNLLSGSYGIENVDIAAPGTAIYTVLNEGYGYDSGTSFAAPMATGMVALMYSIPSNILLEAVLNQPKSTAQKIKTILLESAESIEDLNGKIKTGGKIDASYAIAMTMDTFGIDSITYCNIDSIDLPTLSLDTFFFQNDSIISGFNNGYRPSQLLKDTIEQGRYIPVGISPNPDYLDSIYVSIWLDENRDSVFSEHEQLLFDSIQGKWAGTVFIPEDIDTGYYHLRVGISALTDSINPCAEKMTTYEFEDYSLFIKINPLLCPPPPTVDSIMIGDTTASILWDMVDSSVAYIFRYRAIGSGEWEDEMVDTAKMFTINGLDECKPYEFQVRSVCYYDTSSYSLSYEFQTDCPTSIDGVELSNEVHIYPNPNNGSTMTIELPSIWAVKSSEWQISVYSMNGQQMIRQNTWSSGKVLSVDDMSLPSGLYMVNIFNGEAYANKKLIIQ